MARTILEPRPIIRQQMAWWNEVIGSFKPPLYVIKIIDGQKLFRQSYWASEQLGATILNPPMQN
jgi:hypothetical protein